MTPSAPSSPSPCPSCKPGPPAHDSLREISRADVLAALPPSGPAARHHRAGPAVDLPGTAIPQAGLHQPHLPHPRPRPGHGRPARGRPGRHAGRPGLAQPGPRRDHRPARLPRHPDAAAGPAPAHRHPRRQAAPGRPGDPARRARPRTRQTPTSPTGPRPGRPASTPTCSSTPAAGQTTRPVTSAWIGQQLGISAEHIRLDRIYQEVEATGGDIRALCDLFGMSIANAARWATTRSVS